MNQTPQQKKAEKKRRRAAERQARAKGKHIRLISSAPPTQFMTGQG